MNNLISSLSVFLKSPLARISFGLTMLMLSLVFISDLAGLLPSNRETEIEYRRFIAESLSTQLALEIEEIDLSKLRQLADSGVLLNDRLSSVAIRRESGDVVHITEGHDTGWTLSVSHESTAEQMRVQLHTRKGPWGNVEYVFKPLGFSLFSSGSFSTLVAYIAFAGFCGFFLYLKRVLRELDPKQMMPDRVRTSLDSLTDSLLVLDTKGILMFGNQSFAKKVGYDASSLIGKHYSHFTWLSEDTQAPMPWQDVIRSGDVIEGKRLILKNGQGRLFQFMVSATPIYGSADTMRGVLVTLNDISELVSEKKKLENTLNDLDNFKQEIVSKNEELYKMATRDPLTDVFNRRAFFDSFDNLISQAIATRTRLGCIMVDIDHFKSINDNYGHAFGDVVIKYLANVMVDFAGQSNVVGRFGGEEFCMVIPEASLAETAELANKIRIALQQDSDNIISAQATITSSFGVCVLSSDSESSQVLIEQADKALYHVKENGRNGVGIWGRSGASIYNSEKSNDVVADEKVEYRGPASDEIIEKILRSSQNESTDESVTNAEDQSIQLNMRSGDASTDEGAQIIVESETSPLQRYRLLYRIEQALGKAKLQKKILAVLVLDSTSVNRIAETVGYSVSVHVGVELLRRLKQQLRETDVISLGSNSAEGAEIVSGSISTIDEKDAVSVSQTDTNEIVIVVSEFDQVFNILGIVERIRSVFEHRILVDGMEFMLETSIGVSIYDSDGHEAAILLQKAYSACRNARDSSEHNAYCLYSKDVAEAAKRALRLQADLYLAIEREEFYIAYQPKMSLVTGKLLGFEALLRWNHVRFGLVSPDEFIPLAEKSGMIKSITSWVLDQVSKQVRHWQSSLNSDISVAVNISAVELHDVNFANRMVDVLEGAELNPHSLELEITETADIESLQLARENLEILSDAGFKISVDDFGTGYASLRYLQDFPIDRLKIDRSFIQHIASDGKKARVVHAIITLGQHLGLRVLAEGVETQDQLEYLVEHHCDEVQGFLISAPVSSEVATSMLVDSSLLSEKIYAAELKISSNDSSYNISVTGLSSVVSLFPGNHRTRNLPDLPNDSRKAG